MTAWLFIINHWLHLVSAVAALGGSMFLRFVVHPSAQTLPAEGRAEFDRKIKRKATMFVLHPMLVLIITGFINFARAMGEGVQKPYQAIFGIKFLLVMALFGIVIALTVPSDALAKFQANRPKWILVNVILGIIIVFLSAWLRMIPRVQ